jgi:thiamine thiazole synthase
VAINEVVVSEAIISSFFEKLKNHLDVDVAIVGAGPSGLVAGYYLSREGLKTVIFEKRLSVGGGMWAGAMFFNQIVVQEEGKKILEEFEISHREFLPGYYVCDAPEAVSAIAYKTIKSGTVIFNGMYAEDVVLKDINGEPRVCGLVVNWSVVEGSGLMVDPLVVSAKYVVDATGHDACIVSVLQKKAGIKLNTSSGKVEGERPLWAEVGERETVENAKEVFPGLFVSGLSANATFGSPRMGPIFGGMLLSGKKVAEEIIRNLKG